MDSDDGVEENEPLFRWLPPDDRLWRHPSELARNLDASGRAREMHSGSVFPGAPSGDMPGRPTLVTGRRATTTFLTAREIDRRLWTVALMAGVVGALFASGAGVVAGQYHHSTTVVRPIEQVVQATPYLTVAAGPKVQDIVDVAARMRPNIVELLVSSNGANATGSGVIFTADGYVLTNDHVVAGAQSVVAIMSDGRHVRCRLIGTDKISDIAVVKLQDVKAQSAAVLGTSTQLKVGQLAIAIGLTGGPSVTSGIISAVDRAVVSGIGPPLVDMIQTDASIEPGSSGGALVDGNGMVIGITTVVALADQSSQTLGFATPIEVARDVANQILSTGKVTHAWLGVEGADVDVATAKLLGISGGAVVQSVDTQSPAARAGVTATDVVTAFAGQNVDSMSTLEMSVRQHRPGDRVSVSYLHNGETRSTDVVLLERPLSDDP